MACKDSFKATQKKESSNTPGYHNEKGLVACLCVHNIPLLICNITTPGEWQMYAIALICQLREELPSHATLGVLYNIGCVLNHSCALYGYLGPLWSCVVMAISILHFYRHQWAYQQAYSPCHQAGFSLANGEQMS
ncbi:hypothetical protein DACRYDRAFT_60406, partial [Dacryopinax primogenitus]